MEREAYDSMYHLEDTYWWYVGMRALTRVLLDDIELPRGRPEVLDAGCGTGANVAHFADLGAVTGVDIVAEALAYCRQRNITSLAQASVTDLPFANDSFDLIMSFDVLYHAQVGDDVAALHEFYRLLSPGGHCLVRLPAYRWCMSGHDAAVHTRQRYTAGELRAKALDAGFEVARITYLNSILLPLAILRRLAARQGEHVRSDVRPLWSPLNGVLRWILVLERHFLARWNLPFGLSVIAVLRKQ
jgi:SAM-dependent methyltransferase